MRTKSAKDFISTKLILNTYLSQKFQQISLILM